MSGRLYRCILRRLAHNCILPSLRMRWLRASGIEIGEKSFVNMGVVFIDNYAKGKIVIGKRVAVAPGAMFISDSDPNNSRLREIPSFNLRGTIRIGDDSWIGAGAIILPNVVIGNNVVVGSGAIVTKSIEDYSIVVGNPARKIGDVKEREGWEKVAKLISEEEKQ